MLLVSMMKFRKIKGKLKGEMGLSYRNSETQDWGIKKQAAEQPMAYPAAKF